MKGNVFIDHIYDLIKVDEVLSELIDAFKSNIEECKRENQIFLISKIYPTATHRRWEHQLGVYNLINSCVNTSFPNIKRKLQSKELMAAALLHNIGHSKIGYDTEEAFLYYINKNKMKDYFKDRYKDVYNILSSECNKCDKKCLESIVDRNLYKQICNWETAKIIRDNKDKLDLIKGIDKYLLIKYCVCPKNKGFELIEYFNKIDYVLRDLFHLGVLSFRINLQYLFAKYDKVTSLNDINEFEMINNYLYLYIKDNVYNDNKVLIHSRRYQKFLLNYLSEENININNLKSLKCLDSDSKIDNYIEEVTFANKYIEVFSTENDMVENLSNLYAEEVLLPTGWDLLKYEKEKNILLAVYDGERKISDKYKKLKVFAIPQVTKLNDIFDLLMNVSKGYVTKSDFRRELLTFILMKKINIDFERYTELLKEIILEIIKQDKELILNVINEMIGSEFSNINVKDEKKDGAIGFEHKEIEAENTVENKCADEETSDNEINGENKSEVEEQPNFINDLFKLISQNSIISAKASIERETYEFLNEKLIPQLIESPQEVIKREAGKTLVKLIGQRLEALIKSGATNNAGIALEYFVYLKECLISEEDEKLTLVYPSVLILEDSNSNKSNREIDCLTIKYKEGKISMDFIEITTNDSRVKSISDLTKNRNIIDDVQKRYNYINIKKRIITPVENIKIETIENTVKEPLFR